MEIYIVQPGDNIYTIAVKYGVTPLQIIYDNGIDNPLSLIPGQTIIITYPSKIHTVQAGDNLSSIASSYGISIMQLLRNNSYLSGRNNIYPGETLVISYDTSKKINVNGYTYPFINKENLKRTLPFLTFLSIFNYRVLDKGEVLTYRDDYEIIEMAKDYGTIPLLMISTLNQSGENDLEIAYKILSTAEYQDILFQNILKILQSKGYSGVNIVISAINTNNQNLYINFLTKISKQLNNEGYLLFVTINPNIRYADNKITFEQIDYNTIGKLVYRLTFFQYYWGINTNPPSPVSSIEFLKAFSNYLISITLLDNISIGKPVLAYDWTLPFIQGESYANSLSINSALTLANEVGTTIQFDETSQTPFYYYNRSYVGEPEEHIVWSIDARSINALDDLIVNYGYTGSGIWNIMSFNQQMWTIIISRFEITKLIPDNIS